MLSSSIQESPAGLKNHQTVLARQNKDLKMPPPVQNMKSPDNPDTLEEEDEKGNVSESPENKVSKIKSWQ
jgi:hypothetical protein